MPIVRCTRISLGRKASGRFLSTAGEALKGLPRKVLIANKIPVWNSESKQQWKR